MAITGNSVPGVAVGVLIGAEVGVGVGGVSTVGVQAAKKRESRACFFSI